jgi:hypothetical protein
MYIHKITGKKWEPRGKFQDFDGTVLVELLAENGCNICVSEEHIAEFYIEVLPQKPVMFGITEDGCRFIIVNNT